VFDLIEIVRLTDVAITNLNECNYSKEFLPLYSNSALILFIENMRGHWPNTGS